MAHIPSPDKDLIDQVLFDRLVNNMEHPIPDHESSLLVNSPSNNERSVGRMNSSFSRTKIASGEPDTEKAIMNDAKKKLFEDKLEEEEEFLLSKQNTLMRQLLEQQHELKRLESKQQELINLKNEAESRLVDANNMASETIKVNSDQGTPLKMHNRYNNTNEIPYQIEQVSEGNLVSYESSEDGDFQDPQPLNLESFQFDALQAKLLDLNMRQKSLEKQSKRNQNLANTSFQKSIGDQQVEKEDTRKEVTYAKEDVAYAKEEESYEDKEGGYEDTGHANNADYDQLCSKVEELRDRKKYMDQLLSYYNLLRDSNGESKEVIEGDDVLKESCEKFGDPSERDQEMLKLINTFGPASKQVPNHVGGHAAAKLDTFQRKVSPAGIAELATFQQRNRHQGIEEISTPGVQGSSSDDPRLSQDVLEKKRVEDEIRREKIKEEDKMEDIQSMRDQLFRIQQEMGSITFTETDSAENITDKLKGLEVTRDRVKDLRERLSQFEQTDEIEQIPNMTGDTEEEKLQALLRAREKLQNLHDLAAKVKEARAGGMGIPEEVLNEISMIAPKEQSVGSTEEIYEVEEEEEEEETELLDTSTDDKLSALLRRKLELETIQNELKHLRDQQQLLSQMEEEQTKAPARVVPEGDREHLWESLREKQAAQLDRLKKSEARFDGDSNDGCTTRATWGGSSIRSLETDQAVGDDIEGGTYPDKTFEDEDENDEVEDNEDVEHNEESRDTRLLYEIETNYWIDHCKQLSKQLAERTHTIHMLLGDKNGRGGSSMDGSRIDMLSKIEQLTVENDALHGELNEIYGMDTFQHDPTSSMQRRADESEFSTPAGRNRTTDKAFSPQSSSSTPYSASSPHYATRARQFRKQTTPSAYPAPASYYGHNPYYPRYAPYYPPPPHHYNPYYNPYTLSVDQSMYSEDESFTAAHGGPYPSYPDYTYFNQSNYATSAPSDPNSPFVTRSEFSEGTQTEKVTEKPADNKNAKNVSFSLSQVKTSGDTISTQYPTPRKHEAYQKLAESGEVSKEAAVDDESDSSSSSSSVSLQIVEEPEAEPLEEQTDGKAGGAVFETLQNTVYSEVASLISANETRPHYLVELVKELAELDNDYLRQRHLFMLKDLRKGYITADKQTDIQTGEPPVPSASWLEENNWNLLSASEATPSNNSVASDVENDYVQDTSSKVDDAEYDYLESVENLSSVSTTNSHPFASDSLGSTAINLSTDLADVRMREEMEKRLEDVVQDVIAKYGIRKSESSSAADNTSECEETSDIESSFSVLEQEVKRVIIQVIPILRDNLCEVLSTPLELNIAATVIRTTASVFDNDQISENFASNLTNALKKYEGQTVQEAAHSIIVDLSEVLFQDVHSYHMIVDEESDISETEEEEDELILENGPTPTPQDIRNRFLESTGVGYDESDDPELEYSDATGNEVECAVNNTQEEEEIQLSIAEQTPIQHRFNETGELFSDGGEFSDVVELPATTTEDDSGDEVPVRESSTDNIITVSDLPTKLNVPTMASYRDAVVGQPSTQPPPSSPKASSTQSPANSPSRTEEENAAAASNLPEGEGLQAALEILGASKLAGDDSTIVAPP